MGAGKRKVIYSVPWWHFVIFTLKVFKVTGEKGSKKLRDEQWPDGLGSAGCDVLVLGLSRGMESVSKGWPALEQLWERPVLLVWRREGTRNETGYCQRQSGNPDAFTTLPKSHPSALLTPSWTHASTLFNRNTRAGYFQPLSSPPHIITFTACARCIPSKHVDSCTQEVLSLSLPITGQRITPQPHCRCWDSPDSCLHMHAVWAGSSTNPPHCWVSLRAAWPGAAVDSDFHQDLDN